MRRMGGIFRHVHGLERLIDPSLDLMRFHAEVFQAKGDVFLHNGGDDLVIRVLKDHADLLPDVPDALFVAGIHAVHHDAALLGQIKAV